MSKLYHQTDAGTAEIILRTQCMKPGSVGLAGGGIYFATTPELTGHKAHKKGVILEATVALGKIHTLVANGDPTMTLQKLKSMGFDSVCIARAVSSGQEYVVYDPGQVTRIIRDGAQAEAAAAEAAAAEAAAKAVAEKAAAEKAAAEKAAAKRAARKAAEAPVKNFRGPCADCCKPLAPCCCVSADGEAIFGCVPTKPGYFLPACLHMALCPQLGCDPMGGDEKTDCCCGPLIATLQFTPFVFCIQDTRPISSAYESGGERGGDLRCDLW